jgi:hypothetical protein
MDRSGGLQMAPEREQLRMKEEQDRLRMQEFTFASLGRRFDSTAGISEGDPMLQLFFKTFLK